MPAIETVRVSKQGRDQLIRLKRLTGIENWNTLCRWAFCVSLAEPSPPPNTNISADGPIEMTWRTFGGPHADIYAALLAERCRRDGVELSKQELASQFRLHLHRGISYLAGDPDVKGVASLLSLA